MQKLSEIFFLYVNSLPMWEANFKMVTQSYVKNFSYVFRWIWIKLKLSLFDAIQIRKYAN